MSLVKIEAYRLACDRCGEHDGEYYDTPHQLLDDMLLDGWTRDENGITCLICNEKDRQDECDRSGGHEWDTVVNRNLATMWASGSNSSLRSSPDTEFILRHCGRNCGRTEMRHRNGEWLGFDRWGWLGDSEQERVEKRRMRETSFKVKEGQKI